MGTEVPKNPTPRSLLEQLESISPDAAYQEARKLMGVRPEDLFALAQQKKENKRKGLGRNTK